MGRLLDTVKQFFTDDQWGFNEADSGDGLSLVFGGKNGQWNCYARVREDAGQFLFYSFTPFDIAEAQRGVVAELLNRINFGLFIGNFELNFLNGTLQYRTSIDVEGTEASLNSQTIKHMVYQNVLTMDRYLPALRQVADGHVAPAEAVAAVRSAR